MKNDPPVVRVTRMRDKELEVVRIAEPFIHNEKPVVDVKYQVFIKTVKDQKISEINEIHPMRFLFLNEVKKLGQRHKLNFRDYYKWLTFIKPADNDWYALFILQK